MEVKSLIFVWFAALTIGKIDVRSGKKTDLLH